MPLAQKVTEAAGRKLVFLFVDDPAEAVQHGRLLESFGYAVRASKDPGSVSGGVLMFAPAAFVIDNTQPRYIDETLAALARLSDAGRLTCPAIFVGKRDDLALRIRAVQSGCSAFLYRPVGPMHLVDALDLLTGEAEEEPLRVLVLDDSPTQARRHAGILERAGMRTMIVTDPMAVVGPLQEFEPELILMDLYMPGCDGSLLAGVIRQERAFDSIPIVFLSGEADENARLVALRHGGDDFLSKPIEPAHLVQAVTIRARRFRGLRGLIHRDSLTGLLNHTTTMRHLESEVERARAGGGELSVAYLDIDRFKRINDTFGHPTGDIVIKSLARLLRQRLRPGELIGRMGGEEFAAVLPGMGVAEARATLDDIRAEFADMQHVVGGACLTAAFSCGVAGTHRFPGTAELNAAADRALYRAKNEGRNQVLAATS